MSTESGVVYNLHLQPLRRHPELTESIIYGLKWTLSAVFEDPFAVRDVVVAVRELVDNMLTHGDWEGSPAPSLRVQYHSDKGRAFLRVISTNLVNDLTEASRAAHFVQEYGAQRTSEVLDKELAAHLTDTGLQEGAGMGLLQVASSPRCRLKVKLEGSLFSVRVDVEVPELKAQRLAGGT